MDKKKLKKIEKAVKKAAERVTFDRNKPPPEAVDIGEVMKTPEMQAALTKEIDGEIVDALHVAAKAKPFGKIIDDEIVKAVIAAAKDKPLEVEKHYLTALRAVRCRKAGCGLVDINTCRESCTSFGGYVYRANGTDMDVICFEDSKDKAWKNLPAVKKGKK